ncbi:type II toxin-antitoxin system VapB family antitoxin [Ruania rhizosphaerae]|uniref:type II toxin-antitoxin system VapB family antitoxin n=1 Tax=Ruania rhizosphaerae TaxID=1840413 RepID=UPI00135BCED5|nr:type II toxin-antitoxin system VapB family antitoxin [Ruania rhizosphaerae]
MRTTVNIDDAVLRQARRRAGERGETLGSLVEEALRRVLAETEERRPPVSLPVFSGDTGPLAGVDLTSKESIEEAIDGGIPPAKLR